MKRITRYEHEKIIFTREEREEGILDALLRFNEYHGNKYFDGIANGLKLKQYVGIIQVHNYSIEILPKADRQEGDHIWREVLIQMLKATGRLSVTPTSDARVKRHHLNLLEIYFEMYLKEIQLLLRNGLSKKYRKQTGNLNALKGKLEFAGNIRENLVNKSRFYTQHQVYDANHKIHQVLSAALDIVEQFTRGSRIHDLCRRVLLDFPEVDRIAVRQSTFDSIHLDRKSAPYQKALEIARLIILNHSPDIKAGREKMVSILFDMNVLWEEYILTKLRKAARGTSTTVKGQSSKKFWGAYRTIRPDIVIESTTGETIVMDTKWKNLINRSASVEDLRQMYTYCRFWNARKSILLYPGSHPESTFTDFKNFDHDQMAHSCKIAFVNVLDEHNKLDTSIGARILGMLENS